MPRAASTPRSVSSRSAKPPSAAAPGPRRSFISTARDCGASRAARERHPRSSPGWNRAARTTSLRCTPSARSPRYAGDVAAAEELFRRVEQGAGGPGGSGNLARRAARSRAEILIAAGRGAEAAPVFEALLRKENEPMDRIGLASPEPIPCPPWSGCPPEMIAGLPLKERIQFLLLFGGLARESGRYALAVERLTRAGKELEEAISSGVVLLPRSLRTRSDTLESLRLQIERLRSLRQRMVSTEPSRRRRSGPTRWSCWPVCSSRIGPSPGPRRRRRRRASGSSPPPVSWRSSGGSRRWSWAGSRSTASWSRCPPT